MNTRSILHIAIALVMSVVAVPAALAFNSGSTGSDGALEPTANVELTIPASGVFNYTTINIPTGVTVTFKKDSKNSPIIILASGNVTISGAISVNGSNGTLTAPGIGGPGGFNGGIGGGISQPGRRGEGPGGGGYGLGTACSDYCDGGGGGGYLTAGNNANQDSNGCSREPSNGELARETGLSIRRVSELRGAVVCTASLDTPVGEEDSSTLGEVVADENAPNPARLSEERNAFTRLGEALAHLPERESRIIRSRFGLSDGREKSLEEVGEEFHLTRERVRQVQKVVLTKLHRMLREAATPPNNSAAIREAYDQAA